MGRIGGTRGGDLIRAAKLEYLGAEIRALQGAQMLVIRLAVAVVLEEDVGRARLHLRLHYRMPHLLRAHHTRRTALRLVPALITSALLHCALLASS